MRGGAISVMCRIPKSPDNRRVAYGLEDALSTRDMDGMAAPITYRKIIENVGCPPQVAICSVTDNRGKTKTRKQDIRVLGCPESEDDAQQPW